MRDDPERGAALKKATTFPYVQIIKYYDEIGVLYSRILEKYENIRGVLILADIADTLTLVYSGDIQHRKRQGGFTNRQAGHRFGCLSTPHMQQKYAYRHSERFSQVFL